MAFRSSVDRYGTVAVAIHWLSALLILTLLVTGLRAGEATDPSAKLEWLRLHLPAGGLLWLITIVRIGWWLLADKKPRATPMPIWQGRVSKAVHVVFYVLVLAMIASGLGMIVLSGAVPIIVDQDAAALPDFWSYPPRMPHGIGARVLGALILLHAGAAIYHHYVKKDELLKKMWF